jgi:hypothetical protein
MVKLPIEYSDKAVTPFGGMSLMKRFVDQFGGQKAGGYKAECQRKGVVLRTCPATATAVT